MDMKGAFRPPWNTPMFAQYDPEWTNPTPASMQGLYVFTLSHSNDGHAKQSEVPWAAECSVWLLLLRSKLSQVYGVTAVWVFNPTHCPSELLVNQQKTEKSYCRKGNWYQTFASFGRIFDCSNSSIYCLSLNYLRFKYNSKWCPWHVNGSF